MKIGDLDVADGLLVITVVEDGITLGLISSDMTDIEIFVLCLIIAASVTEVIGFEPKDSSVSLLDGYVADMHIANETSSILVRLEIERILDRADTDAVHPYPLHATTHLRTDA